MPLNTEDAAILSAERDAEPERYHRYDPTDQLERSYQASATAAVDDNTEERERNTPGQEPYEERAEAAESIASVSTRDGQSARWRHRPSLTSTKMEEMFMSYLDRHPTAMQRISQHRLQHEKTVGSGRALSGEGKLLPAFGGGKPYPPPLPDREEYVVEFDGHNDPRHAQNWPMKKRMGIAVILIYCAFCCTFASSIMAPTAAQIEAEFNVGLEVATLGTSLFVLGYALGPIIFAPMSELYGRRLPIISSMFGFGVFNIGVAVAKDLQTLMICRFFAGCFGSSPLTIVAAIFSDMFDNRYRGLSVACFSAMVINGPLMGPFIGGFITKSYLGWRWTSYLTAIMGFAGCVLTLIFEDESYPPIVLTQKAAELRRITHNWGIHAKQEEVEVDFNELVNKNISRPLRILFTEPIVLFVTIYMSFLYGLLYLSITAYDLIFAEVYGMPLGVSGLPYFGMVVGDLIGFVVIATDVPRYNRKLAANNGIPVPEWRMPIAMAGGISFAIGKFSKTLNCLFLKLTLYRLQDCFGSAGPASPTVSHGSFRHYPASAWASVST